MIKRLGSCSLRQITCVGNYGERSMIEGVLHPHQVMDQEEVGIAHIAIGQELHLVSHSQHCHARINWKKGKYKRSQGSSHHNMGNDAMSKALLYISKSPFVRRINKARLPHRFSQPTFTIYNGRFDPMEHGSHFNQKMTVHSSNEALMCKVFPSSLGHMAMQWFDALEEGLINSFEELTRAFRVRFVTCSRVLKPLDSLLSMAMKEGVILKTYSDRHQEHTMKQMEILKMQQ